MIEHKLELSPAAMGDLKALPTRVQRDIAISHLPIIREKPYQVGKPLLCALYKERSYHFGRKPEYRIIYFIEDNLITVTLIGTRESIYKKAKRRH
jgi:mRNA-degrading endonuclease RelE of RelBE toxin-antitoxin system